MYLTNILYFAGIKYGQGLQRNRKGGVEKLSLELENSELKKFIDFFERFLKNGN